MNDNLLAFILLLALFVLIVIMVLYFLLTFLGFESNRFFKKKNKKFNELIHSKFGKGLLSNQSDLQILFDAFVSENDSSWFFRYTPSLVPMLENFLLDDIEETEKNLIMSFIQEKQTLIPFDGVPTEERIILTTICNSLNDKQDALLIANLKQLGATMATRYNDYEKTKKISKKSFVISVISVIVGVTGVVLMFYF